MARRRTDTLNVWPAFTDTMLAFVLVLVLMVIPSAENQCAV